MTIDVGRLRSETPGVEHVVHLNNAGASLMPMQVIEAVYGFFDMEIRMGGYEAAAAFADEIEGVYGSIASLINAEASEIALQDTSTRAWDLAFYGVPISTGDRIITTSTEYWSNLAAYLHARDEIGAVIEVVPDTPDGDIDLVALERTLDPSVALVSVNHVPTNSGLVNPAAAIGQLATEAGVPYLLDACQSVGQVPIDVEEIGCDLLSATSRKWLRGPRGAGFLYVRDGFRDRLDHPMVQVLDGAEVFPDRLEPRDDARRFESWEKSHATMLGMGAGADLALALGMEAVWERIRELGAETRNRLSEVPGVAVHDRGSLLGGIVTFTVDGHEAIAVRDALRERNINVSVATSHSSPIDMTSRGLTSVVRASTHVYNTVEEIDRLCEALNLL